MNDRLLPRALLESTSAQESSSAPAKVPLTIITGFLGAVHVYHTRSLKLTTVPSVQVLENQLCYSSSPSVIRSPDLAKPSSRLHRYILTEQHGYRIAVIMNEFGDTADIEGVFLHLKSAHPSLVTDDTSGRKIEVASGDSNDTSANSEEFLELANGCLCCSVKDSGAAAIEKLMKKRGRFDYILLETTGLADPGPIASIFWSNEDLSEDILLDSIVSVVDGVFGLQVSRLTNRSNLRNNLCRLVSKSELTWPRGTSRSH